MKTPPLLASALVFVVAPVRAQSTTDAADKYAWSANTGLDQLRMGRPQRP